MLPTEEKIVGKLIEIQYKTNASNKRDWIQAVRTEHSRLYPEQNFDHGYAGHIYEVLSTKGAFNAEAFDKDIAAVTAFAKNDSLIQPDTLKRTAEAVKAAYANHSL